MVNHEDLDCRADCETVQELHLYYQSEKTVASLNLLIRFIDVNAFFHRHKSVAGRQLTAQTADDIRSTTETL